MNTLAKLGIFGAAAYGAYRLAVKYNLVEKAVTVVDEVKDKATEALGKALFTLGTAAKEEETATEEKPKDPWHSVSEGAGRTWSDNS